MTKYPTDPSIWPDPLRKRRPFPSLADRLNAMRQTAKEMGYGPIDRQALMANPEEIEELLTLLELNQTLRRINTMATGDRDDQLNAIQVELAGTVRALGLEEIANVLEIVD